MAQNFVTMVTSDHPYRWFDLNDELETHVKEISFRGCELVRRARFEIWLRPVLEGH